MSIPIVLILGFLAFGMVKWGKQKVTPIIVGVLFGLALASTAVGPQLLAGARGFGDVVVAAVAGAIG